MSAQRRLWKRSLGGVRLRLSADVGLSVSGLSRRALLAAGPVTAGPVTTGRLPAWPHLPWRGWPSARRRAPPRPESSLTQPGAPQAPHQQIQRSASTGPSCTRTVRAPQPRQRITQNLSIARSFTRPHPLPPLSPDIRTRDRRPPIPSDALGSPCFCPWGSTARLGCWNSFPAVAQLSRP